MNSLEKAKKIGELLDNKKGEDIAILNVSGITSLTFSTICSWTCINSQHGAIF